MADADRSEGRGRTAVIALALLVVALVVFLVRGEYRARTEIVEASVGPDDAAVTLRVASCDGDPRVSDLNEIDDEVRIAVTSTKHLWGDDDCLDQLVAELERPLGERRLVDLETGDVVDVAGR